MEQVAGTSLAMQERYCREYAEREDWDILTVFVEEGESAKTANRTKFQEALNSCAIKKKPVDFFLVYKLDRFARNQDDHAVTQTFLKRYGTKLRSVTEQIDESPVGRAMEGMLSVFAEFDNNVRSSRSKGGMIERVKQGTWVWETPVGYTRLVKAGSLVADEDYAPYIRIAFEEWAKGIHSYQSLADFLTERGFHTRNGKKPCAQLIEKIIRNPLYCGTIRAFGLEVKGTFEPLVLEELWWKCQSGVRRRFGNIKRDSQNPLFPLRKLTICTDCGKAITGSVSTGRRGIKYPYYHHQKLGCPRAAYISKETLEQNFIEYLQEISPSKKYEKIFKAIVIDVWQANYKKLDVENARVRKEVEALEGDRQRVFDLHRAGAYSDPEFLEQKDLINIKIQQKKLLLEEKQIEEFGMEEALDSCFRFVRDSARTWVELADHPVHRLRFQKQVFPQKVTFNGEKFGTTKMSLIYKLNKETIAETSKVVTPGGIEPPFPA